MSKQTEQELKKEIEELQAKLKRKEIALEEVQKREVRHGDYGMSAFDIETLNLSCSGQWQAAYRHNLENSCRGGDLGRDGAKIYGNIFDKLEKGPILVPLTVEEADYVANSMWAGVVMRSVGEKIKEALKEYRDA